MAHIISLVISHPTPAGYNMHTFYFYWSSLGELCCDEICPKSIVAHRGMVTSCYQGNQVVPVTFEGSSMSQKCRDWIVLPLTLHMLPKNN